MKAQAGDTVKVVAKLNGHRFQIGEEITVLKVNEKKGGFLCTNDVDEWWLEENEFE